MHVIFSFLLRLFLVLVGLAFAAFLAVAVALMLTVWLLRALWSRVTGRPVSPFIMRMNPRQGFDTVFRRAPSNSRTPRADAAAGPRPQIADVTDVQPRDPG